MQNSDWIYATIALLVVYAGVLILLAVRAARRTRTLADYALGAQGFSPVVVGLSLAANITSAATFIINPGFVAMFGWSAFLAMSVVLPLGLYLSLIVLTRSFRRYGSSVKALTLAQWMGKRYESQGLALWFAVLSFLLVTFIVLICVGLTKVLAGALGARELPVLIGLVVVVFGYMMFGGATSMVYTNAVQAGLMLVVAVVLLASGWKYFDHGTGGFWEKLAAIDPLLVQSTNPKSPLFRDWFEVFFCNFIVGIAIVCQPHIVTRSLLLRSEKDINRYLLVALVAESVFFAVLFVGFYARLTFPELTLNGTALKMDGIVSAYVVRVFPVGVGLLVVLGLLSAGLSTLEGLIQSLSTTFTNDLIAPLTQRWNGGRPMPAERLTRVNKGVIVVLAVVAIVWSYQQLLYPNLSVGILAQNGVYAFFSAAFVPVLFGIYGKNVPRLAPALASVTAVVVHFSVYYGALTPYTTGAVRNPAVAAALAILAATAVGGAVFLWKKKAISARAVATGVVLSAAPALFAFETRAHSEHNCASTASSHFTCTDTLPMQTISYPADLRYIALSGGKKIAYLDRGAGEQTLLFLHGLGSNLKCWQKNLDTLSRRFRCIALDLPGYGMSSKSDDYPYGMAFFADVVREFMDSLHLQNVVLVGHSMGGQIALTEVLRGNDRIKKMVLLAPAGIETFSEQEKTWFRTIYTPEMLMNTSEAQIRRNFELNFVQFPPDAEFMYQDRLRLRQTSEYAAYCRMIPKCVQGMLNEPVFERLGEIRLPVLIVYGENDALIPNRFLHPRLTTQQIAQLAQERIPGSQLVLLPNCGHFVQWEGAAGVNEAIMRFLR
ncbi:MAG: alpha/beta fold hydrolase [Saprospiraceae bacterium]|nr:alpha/beta fold hydrolase [Saprospiraceae bacterium]MDW8229944.1 alpha/beta fold hydrolase [Saprospiraceae bacterium]